jgi:hypothetical protein
MHATASAKPAPAATGNRLQEVDRLGGAIIQAKLVGTINGGRT